MLSISVMPIKCDIFQKSNITEYPCIYFQKVDGGHAIENKGETFPKREDIIDSSFLSSVLQLNPYHYHGQLNIVCISVSAA